VETVCKRVHGTHLLKLGSVLLLAGLLVWGLTFTSSMQSARDMTSRRMDNLKSYDNSSQARVQLWIAAAKMAVSNPWLGVGPGEFASNYPRYQTRFYYYSDSAHSAGLELASEVGIVGLAFFTAGLLALLFARTRKFDPLQRFALLGLFCGLGYAQIDLAYQISYFWLTIAVLCHLAIPPASNPEPDNRVSPLRVVLGIVAVGLAFYLVPPLRKMEGARQIKDPQQSLEVHQYVLKRLPWWRRAVISTYQIKLEETETLPTFEETELLLQSGEGLAITHALAGKWYLHNDDFAQALQEYRKALALDPWNDPTYYGDLRRIGVALSDQALIQEAENTLLTRYSFEESMLAPPGHRDFLQYRLQRSLLDLADGLNPLEQPLKTEPIYRALYDFRPSANVAFGLGISLQRQGRTEEARPYLEEAHRKHPMFPPPGSF
ncbi:MAG: O-antigen ligase family protein, partial [Vulcanimicrobiota bacterium]